MNFETSLEKILQSDAGFGDLFYEVFFGRNPDAKPYFKDTNMNAQALMLAVALKLAGEYRGGGSSAIEHYIRTLGTRHSDHRVPREMYPQWRDALLIALEKFHKSDWNEALADEWRNTIDAISVVMFQGYFKRTGL